MSVQERWIYKCDRCGVKVSVDKGVKPKKWDTVRSYDLCPECKNIWDNIFNNFLLSTDAEGNNAEDGE